MKNEEDLNSTAVEPAAGAGLANSLTTFLKFGGALTAIGILVGWLYQQGLMDGMELPATLFPTRVEDLLFMTYLAALVFSTVALKTFGEYLLLGAALAILAALVVGALIAALLWFEDKRGVKGFGNRLLRWTAQRRLPLGMVVGMTSVVVSVATVVGLCSAVVVLVLLPLPAYLAGKEEGARLRSLTGCTDGTGALLTNCAEATFESGEKVVGVYLAGAPGSLALRVDGYSVVYVRPVQTLRFGSHPRSAPTKQ